MKLEHGHLKLAIGRQSSRGPGQAPLRRRPRQKTDTRWQLTNR
jgi:hypothetical protein